MQPNVGSAQEETEAETHAQRSKFGVITFWRTWSRPFWVDMLVEMAEKSITEAWEVPIGICWVTQKRASHDPPQDQPVWADSRRRGVSP